MNSQQLKTAAAWIGKARRLAVLTGAGISAESGVPTFRGAGGLWRTYRAEDLASPQAFARDPLLVWEWYDWRRKVVADCRPNAAHLALASLQGRKDDCVLITQNVDGLHDLAGSRDVLKLHGDIWALRCTACTFRGADRRVPLPELPPPCPECGEPLRPDIVWFGEMLDADVLREAWNAARGCDVFLVVGTSALVQPAASLPLAAASAGARVIEVNLQPTALTPQVDCCLLSAAAAVLPELLAG